MKNSTIEYNGGGIYDEGGRGQIKMEANDMIHGGAKEGQTPGQSYSESPREETVRKIISDYFFDAAPLNGEIINHNEKMKTGFMKEPGGLTNYNYRVTRPGGQYFLKIFRRASPERLRSLVQLLLLLNRHNFPTPPLIPDLHGRFLWSSDEKDETATFAIMTRYIQGIEAPRTIDSVNRIGVVMAALHNIDPGDFTKEVEAPLMERYPLHLNVLLEKIRNVFAGAAKANYPDDLQLLLDQTLDTVHSIPFETLPSTLIHGDVFPDNVLQSEHDDIYLIDFEGGCIDNALFDLARSVIGCCVYRGRIDPHLSGSLVQGYQLFRPLSNDEKDFLFEYIVYTGLVSALWRYYEFYLLRPDEKKTEIYRELLDPTLAFFLNGKNKALSYLLAGL